MAKGNLLIGMGRGKLGDIVLSRAYGQQISRARAKVVKNPRTKGQQVQRIILATVTKAYSQMKSIVDHSWQGVSYGAASMNKFNQLNMDYLRNQLAANGLDNDGESPKNWAWFICPENQLAVPNRWAISRGTLPSITAQPSGSNGDQIAMARFSIASASSDDGLSYDAFINALGLMAGDQITLCVIDHSGRFHYGRLVLSPNDGDMTHNIGESAYFNERSLNISVNVADGNVEFSLDSVDQLVEKWSAFGLILSRKQGTSWQRSNSDMVIWDMDFGGIGDSMNDALYELETGSLDFSSPYYLNNANPHKAASGEGGKENP